MLRPKRGFIQGSQIAGSMPSCQMEKVNEGNIEDLLRSSKHWPGSSTWTHARRRARGCGGKPWTTRLCVQEALERGCGRMERSVLTCKNAIRFYESMWGERPGWFFYRLDEEGIRQASRR